MAPGKESLATLVQEELPSLSKHWLAALKDHALLSLPQEYRSQLPFDGGAFYTNDTMEQARPHYKVRVCHSADRYQLLTEINLDQHIFDLSLTRLLGPRCWRRHQFG